MGNRKTIWVTGAQGFVGSEICEYFRSWGYEVAATDVEVSVCHAEALANFARRVKPAVIINCAGIRRDKADLINRMKAYDVNALGARNLAAVAARQNAVLVQISSDDVYSAALSHSVDELDTPRPDTPYGKSKRAGETMVRTITDNHIIIRSSWLYSACARTLCEILQAAENGETIAVRADQLAAPTSLLSYTATLRSLIEGGLRGTFHVTTAGSVSRYDFAARVLELAGFDPRQVLVARRDANSAQYLVLRSVLLKDYGLELPGWDEDLQVYMRSQGLLAASAKPTFQNHDKVTRISCLS